MATTIPSDAHSSGDTGHIADHNNIADDLGLLAQAIALLNGTANTPPGGNASNISSISTSNTAKFPLVLNNSTTPSTPSAGPIMYGESGGPASVDTQGNISPMGSIFSIPTTGTISSSSAAILPGTAPINVLLGSTYIVRGQIVFDSVTTPGVADFRFSAGSSSSTASSIRVVAQFMNNTGTANPEVTSAVVQALSADLSSDPLVGTVQQVMWYFGYITIGTATGTLQMNTRLDTASGGSYSVKAAGSYLEWIQIS